MSIDVVLPIISHPMTCYSLICTNEVSGNYVIHGNSLISCDDIAISRRSANDDGFRKSNRAAASSATEKIKAKPAPAPKLVRKGGIRKKKAAAKPPPAKV